MKSVVIERAAGVLVAMLGNPPGYATPLPTPPSSSRMINHQEEMISFSLHPRTRIFKEHSNHSTATNNLTRKRKTVALLATDGTDWEEKDTAIDFLMKSSGAALPITKVGKSIKGALLAVGSAG